MPSKRGPKVEKFYHSTQWKRCRDALSPTIKGNVRYANHKFKFDEWGLSFLFYDEWTRIG